MLGPLGLIEATEAWKRLVTSERAVVVVAGTGLVSVQASALHALAYCSLLGRSYTLKASTLLCPVLLWMVFSGIPLLYIRVAPVTRKLWFVLPLIPASLKIVATIASSLFQPTGVTENQGFEGSRGMLFSGVQ